MIHRRAFLSTAGLAGAGLLIAPTMSFARAATDRRFVFIIQRGAADGLSIVAPIDDPDHEAARGGMAEVEGAKLDSIFHLNAAMPETAKMYGAKEALFVHAVASPYRDRSHFDGQNVLETGGNRAYQHKDGWLNRLLGVLPAGESKAIAVASTMPAALRGSREVAAYAPSRLPEASDDLMARVGALYQGDAQLHGLWDAATATRALAGGLDDVGRNAAATGTLAAKLLAPANGARIAVIETGGWDTHSAQKARLKRQLGNLDAMLAALRTGLGPAWKDTLVLVATEFGRTVAVNGQQGTNHGTALAAILTGGTAAGGRVIADWPGLKIATLYEGRDLRPTIGLDALIASALSQHYQVDHPRMAAALFPEIGRTGEIERLIQT